MSKRQRSESVTVVMAKRQKVGIVPATPLEMKDLFKNNIAPYLSLEDLKNYKRLSRGCYEAASEVDCTVKIMAANFQEACMAKRYHLISVPELLEEEKKMRKAAGEYVDVRETKTFNKIVEKLCDNQVLCCGVEYLTIDFGKQNIGFDINVVNFFPRIKELRIIRAVGGIELNIKKVNMPSIRRLTVYTTGTTWLTMDRDLKEILLYSELGNKNSFCILKEGPIDDSRIQVYGGGFTYLYSDDYVKLCKEQAYVDFKKKNPKSSTGRGGFAYPYIPQPDHSLSAIYKKFVPNPKFMP